MPLLKVLHHLEKLRALQGLQGIQKVSVVLMVPVHVILHLVHELLQIIQMILKIGLLFTKLHRVFLVLSVRMEVDGMLQILCCNVMLLVELVEMYQMGYQMVDVLHMGIRMGFSHVVMVSVV